MSAPTGIVLPLAAAEASWLATVAIAYERMLAAIDRAAISVRFEFYTYKAGGPGDRFRTALVAAARRGARVRVMLDALGSAGLPEGYWEPLLAAGGESVLYNPMALTRLAIRNHRKLVVIDDRIAFLGGFNIADEYDGDGVERGWRDLGIAIGGAAPPRLAASFDFMWEHRDLGRFHAFRWRHPPWRRTQRHAPVEVLPTGPGMGRNTFDLSLLQALRTARDVRIICAYFVPTFRLRRALGRTARRGGRVRLILAGKTDVPLTRAATRCLYRRMLDAGIEIAEYEAQILHAKLALVDDVVYVGSSNLDARSLDLNYEIMLRLADPILAREGRQMFDADWTRCRPIRARAWQKVWTLGRRLQGRAALFFLTKIDPWFAHRQLRHLS